MLSYISAFYNSNYLLICFFILILGLLVSLFTLIQTLRKKRTFNTKLAITNWVLFFLFIGSYYLFDNLHTQKWDIPNYGTISERTGMHNYDIHLKQNGKFICNIGFFAAVYIYGTYEVKDSIITLNIDQGPESIFKKYLIKKTEYGSQAIPQINDSTSTPDILWYNKN